MSLPPRIRDRAHLLALLLVVACHQTVAPFREPVPTAPTPPAGALIALPAIVPTRDTATRPAATPGRDEVAQTVVAVFGDTAALHPDSATAANTEPVWDLDVRSFETQERVTHYVQLFTNAARERFVQRLSRGTRYEPMIRAKLRASGMPEDLTYLALVESGYDPNAYSRAAAVGMWQFMSSTARDVGLRVDWWMDERRDPARSTDGAIRFLGDLQKQFGSLFLAAAAYNGGPGRVARGLTRFAGELEGAEGEGRFFALAEQDYLRAETKNYVPQLIAAALIAKMPSRYGLALDSTPPLAYDSLRVAPSTSLAAVARAASATPAALKDLNPAILRGMTPPDTAIWVHLPTGMAERAVVALDSIPPDARRAFRTVTSPALSAGKLAEREGITLKQLGWFNPALKIGKSGRLAAGQTIRIPSADVLAFARELPDPSIERYGGESSRALARGGFHVVRRGESLGIIAKRYGMPVSRLKALNGMRGERVIAGQTLRVSASSRGNTKASAKTVPAKKSSTTKARSKKATPTLTPSKKAPGPKSSAKKPPTKKRPTAKPSTAKSSKGPATP